MTEDHIPFEKPAFRRKYDVEDPANPNKNRNIFSISINPEERQMLDDLKAVLNYDLDSTVLKIALQYLHSVTFQKDLNKWFLRVTSQRRVRPKPSKPVS